MPGVPGIGHGLLLGRGNADGPPETFTTIAKVIDVDLGTQKLDVKESSNQDTAANTKEFVAGLVEAGEVSFDLVLTDGSSSYTQLKTDLEARAAKNYQITPPTAIIVTKKFTFSAFVVELSPKFPNQDVAKVSVKLRINGVITFA